MMGASDTINLIKSRISILKDFKFEETDFKKNNPRANFSSDGFGISGRNEDYNRGASIIFSGQTHNNSGIFFIRLFQLDKSFPDIHFDKYLENRYGREAVLNLNLDNYKGSNEKKIEQFIEFFNSILNDAFMKDAIIGKTWSDQYHKSIWEGTNR